MNINQWHTTGNYFSYKGQHQIFYQESGTGEELTLLHGFPTSSWDWIKIWDQLTKQFHVYTADFIGFGYSDKPKSYTYRIHDQADIIETFWKIKGITSTHILAHDYGDTVAQELLTRFNHRQANQEEGVIIKSLCLLNGGLFPETHRAIFIQKALLSPIGFLFNSLLSRSSIKKNFDKIFGPNTKATEQELDEFYSLITYNNGGKIFNKLIRYMTDRIEHRERWVDALQMAEIPIRVIDGAVDPISGKHMTERYKQLVPNPDIILLDDIGHYPQTEDPRSVLKHFLAFIN